MDNIMLYKQIAEVNPKEWEFEMQRYYAHGFCPMCGGSHGGNALCQVNYQLNQPKSME